LNIKQSVARALQFASSDPKGPVYLCAARETLAEEIEPLSLNLQHWAPISSAALPTDAVETIASALLKAKNPLIITGYSGRDRRCPSELVNLADQIPGLRVHDTGGSDVCFPFDHVASQGFRLSFDDCTKDADVILLANCDVPWIPSRNPPPKDARIYHIDIDPLNQNIPVSFFPAHGRWRVDCYTALKQINDYITTSSSAQVLLKEPRFASQHQQLVQAHNAKLATISRLANLSFTALLDSHNIGAIIKQTLPANTTFIVEAVTSAQDLFDQLQPSIPGSWINCGATGIGWSNGAALGVRRALDARADQLQLPLDDCSESNGLVVQLVGDGSHMCASPASAAWVAAKYHIPLLTIVLNNGGV
jgi:thiamine pyrophosphate-dependent acetolactate synthase large subunit-like protein